MAAKVIAIAAKETMAELLAPETTVVRLVVVKTRLKPMSELLKQFWGVTAGTSTGSTRVRSTHCFRNLGQPYSLQSSRCTLTLYSAAPCWAVSMICRVMFWPICRLKFAGMPICGRQTEPL